MGLAASGRGLCDLEIECYYTEAAGPKQNVKIMEISLHIANSILDAIDFEWKRSIRDSVPSNLLFKRFIPIKSNFFERLSDDK